MNKFLSWHHCRISLSYLLIGVLCLTILPSFKRNAVFADHGDSPTTTGNYRIPYADGVAIDVYQDHHSHGGANGAKDRYDLGGDDAGEQIVAAASGWIRAIVDKHGDSGDLGDGMDVDGNSYPDANAGDALEHSCQDLEDDDGNSIPDSVVPGLCQEYNNYVWIEHPNGEWTKYTHFATGSVNALGLTADLATHDVGAASWINAGEALGVEGDVGRASGRHLHHEAAIPNDPTTDLTWSANGGFFNNGQNLVITLCEYEGDTNDNNTYDQPEDDYVANPCVHLPPTADAGGPYSVDEGSTVPLDGTGSSDPDGNPLTYAWSPSTNLDDPSLAQPTFSGIDDSVNNIQLDVFDQIEQLVSSDSTTVTVNNVEPTVTAVGDTIDEGQSATVSATFTDPGNLDTHTATINWNDGTAAQAVTPAQLASGVAHAYGDNGVYTVTVTVTDDDGGVGVDVVNVTVNNLDPTVTLDTSGAISFPGGDYLVAEAGTELPASADGTDPGSDDLTFTWSTGDVNTYFNNGVSADPLMSPLGTYPFNASDSIDALYSAPGVETLGVVLSDDDGGSDEASAQVIVTGTEDSSRGTGWWKHQYSGNGSPHIDAATAEGYLEIVNAVSSVFSETHTVATMADVHDVLSPTGGDRRARARAQLMAGWLQFASGAVAWDAMVEAKSGPIGFLPLMFAAEDVINNPASTDAELHAIELDLARLHPTN